jgi:hypothetical protein
VRLGERLAFVELVVADGFGSVVAVAVQISEKKVYVLVVEDEYEL